MDVGRPCTSALYVHTDLVCVRTFLATLALPPATADDGQQLRVLLTVGPLRRLIKAPRLLLLPVIGVYGRVWQSVVSTQVRPHTGRVSIPLTSPRRPRHPLGRLVCRHGWRKGRPKGQPPAVVVLPVVAAQSPRRTVVSAAAGAAASRRGGMLML